MSALRRIIMPLTVASAMAWALTSCFTGIESTPRITDRDVERRNATATAEDKFLSHVKPQQLGDWSAGKEFYVTDSKIALALEPGGITPQAGATLRFVEWRATPAVTGGDDTEIVLADSTGARAIYRLNASPAQLKRRDGVSIPFTIERSVVNEVKKELDGKKLYVRTALWYDSVGNSFSGLKYVPVTVDGVTPGNQVYPVRVWFSTDVDGRPMTASVYMSIGDGVHSARNFASMFAFDNPRDRYPTISDDTWQRIIHSRVAVDMTRDECRLALGNPTRIDRYQGTGLYGERWSYDNGAYLIFYDGVLNSFRQ